MGQIICKVQDFSRQKTQYIFDSETDTSQIAQTFFPKDNFPAKRLSFFFGFGLGRFFNAQTFSCQKI